MTIDASYLCHVIGDLVNPEDTPVPVYVVVGGERQPVSCVEVKDDGLGLRLELRLQESK